MVGARQDADQGIYRSVAALEFCRRRAIRGRGERLQVPRLL